MKTKGLFCVVVMLAGSAAVAAQERAISLAELDGYFQQSEKASHNWPWRVSTSVQVGETPKGPWEDHGGWWYSVVPPDSAHLSYRGERKDEFLHIGPLSYSKAEDGRWILSDDTIKGSLTSPNAARRFGDGQITYTMSRSNGGGILIVTVLSKPTADADPTDTRNRTYIMYFGDRGVISGEESIVHNGTKWVRTSHIYTFAPNIRIESPEEMAARQPESVASSREASKLSPGDKPLVILSKPRPGYTEEASKNKVQGNVILAVTFQADGTIGAVGVVKGLDHGITEATMDAARKITFTPEYQNGKPVTVTKQLEYRFRIY